jgi:predicted metal-dependent peptidase
MVRAEIKQETNYDLDMRIYRLLQDEPFFAILSRELSKIPVTSIPTAGIRFNKEQARYELIYNPDFLAGNNPQLPINGFSDEKWVLMHELYHASLGHCTGRTLPEYDKKLANCAMDLAINSLNNMRTTAPEWVLLPGRGEYKFLEHSNEMASEWYAKELSKKQEQNPDKPMDGGDGQFDSHEDFEGDEDGAGGSGEGESAEKQIADKRLADAVAKAAGECEYGDGEGGQPKGWGSVSNQIRKQIKKFANSTKATLDPKKVLASFIKASVAANKKTSVTKRNRRLPGIKFGRRTEHRADIAISIDQSGSVSDELLSKVFDWLGELAKFCSFTVIPFDHQVFEEKVYVWKKGDKRAKERVLYGGTCFDAPTLYVNKRRFDGHVIITDMMAAAPVRSNCQRMWITDTYGANRSYGGHKPVGERVLVL